MKHAVIMTLCLALVAGFIVAPDAHAAKRWDDLSWWGTSGATPDPYPDPRGRSGYWWWPTEPLSNAGDAELWGNRGVVYHVYTPPVEQPVTPPPPPPVEPAPVTRTAPVLNDILFDFDKAVLRPEGRAVADEAVSWMRQYGGDTVTIEGHTCDIGAAEYNMGLGQRRADAVRRYLLENGIAADRVTAVSYGETQPAVANTSPANRRLNRRAVFVFHLAD